MRLPYTIAPMASRASPLMMASGYGVYISLFHRKGLRIRGRIFMARIVQGSPLQIILFPPFRPLPGVVKSLLCPTLYFLPDKNYNRTGK